eukprot:TRINITY_DN21796_c0_g1_i2.p1 TRINITY_DN21796_c0_g1~~TRINITY_DN21796_c0_g1_i2.p1  ORF type:complete len:103 (-),score=17.25 TRINITY_DN21796_c0_g1_i2:37-345(-)
MKRSKSAALHQRNQASAISSGRCKRKGSKSKEKQGPPSCVLCHLPVIGLFAWCQRCSHGGHEKCIADWYEDGNMPVSYTHLRAHETPEHLVCRLLLEKKKKT